MKIALSAKSKNQVGAVAIASLLLMPIIFAIGALAVDFSYQLYEKERLGQAAESTALALVKRKVDEDSSNQSLANKILGWYFPETSITNQIVPIDQGYKVELANTVSYLLSKNLFTDLASITVINQGSASVGVDKPVAEIALVLDFSGSMQGQKMADLKQAAVDFINGIGSKSYISLIPFNGGVSGGQSLGEPAYTTAVSFANRDWPSVGYKSRAWYAADLSEKACISSQPLKCEEEYFSGEIKCKVDSSELDMVNMLFDFPAALSLPHPHLSYPSQKWSGGPWLAEKCSNNSVVPLTNNTSKLLSDLDDFNLDYPSNTTISYEGILWGAKMLSPEWRGKFDDANLPHDFGDIDKHLILFTDGGDTGVYRYILRDLVSQGLCEKMRNNEIKLHYVGYKLGANFKTNNAYHTNCFGEENMVNSENVGELIEAFRETLADSSGSVELKLIKPE